MLAKDHPLYEVWYHMLNRADNFRRKKCYEHVTVFEPWRERFVPRRQGPSPGLLKFAQYVEENLGPQEGRSLDRIDGNKGYEPGNIRWATMLEQNHNRRPGWTHPVRTPGRLKWTYPYGNKWLAKFTLMGICHNLGSYTTMEEAHQAAAAKRKQLLENHA